MNDFNERLLDAGLREYSRVEAPALTLPKAARRPRPVWPWLLLPAAAALATGLFVMRPTPLPIPPATQRVVAETQVLAPRPPVRAVGVHKATRPPFLSGEELARMDLPAEMFVKTESRPVVDLEVPELSIKPLRGSEEADPKENNYD